jgi:membrane protease YdiL (CAAX protease family)
MTEFDDSLLPPQDPTHLAAPEAHTAEPAATALTGDPFSLAEAGHPPVRKSQRNLPEDIRVSWSWVHFIVFVFFAIASFAVVQTALAIYYAPHRHLSQKQLEEYLLNKPQFLIGSNVLWDAAIFLFLYVTIGVLRGLPFWSALGWKKLKSNLAGGKGNPWAFFLSGCGLAVLVFIASARVHGTENMPIQEILKNRNSAMLLMAMAVLIAPLFEETVFRGYLYPLFAKSFGILPSIVVTGVLFGLMHGAQLGWTWGIVVLLILVGIVFTMARAYTGTVLASFLLHLGYNSMIAAATIIGTRGFTQIPTGH